MTSCKYYLCSLIHGKNRDDNRHIYLFDDKLEVVNEEFSIRKIIQGITIKDTDNGKMIESSFQLNNSYHYLPDVEYRTMTDIVDAIIQRDYVICGIIKNIEEEGDDIDTCKLKKKLNLENIDLDDFDIKDITLDNIDYLPKTITIKRLETFGVR